MNVREYSQEADYPMLVQWWEGHGWPALPQAVLPKLGIIVEHNDQPICAGWLYMDNSTGVSMMEWLVTSPSAPIKAVPTAIRVLIEFLAMRAKDMDYGVMLTTCRQPALARIYEKNGFTKTDEGVIHLLRMLKT